MHALFTSLFLRFRYPADTRRTPGGHPADTRLDNYPSIRYADFIEMVLTEPSSLEANQQWKTDSRQ